MTQSTEMKDKEFIGGSDIIHLVLLPKEVNAYLSKYQYIVATLVDFNLIPRVLA